MATDPAPDSKAPAANAPPAMTPYAIAVALFAAFVVGGVLGIAEGLLDGGEGGEVGVIAVDVFEEAFEFLPGIVVDATVVLQAVFGAGF